MTKQARIVLAICAAGIVIAGGVLAWQRHTASTATPQVQVTPAAPPAVAPPPPPAAPAPGASAPDASAPTGSGTVAPAAPPASGVPFADCVHPENPPAPPDGASATQAQMTQAHDTIQAFVNRLETYQACRNAEIDHAGPDVTEQQKQQWLDQGNDAVDAATALAQAFSAQLKVFHATHPGQ